MPRHINGAAICREVDRVCDGLLAILGCSDESEAVLITHWQNGDRPGFQIQMTSRASGKTLTRFVSADASAIAKAEGC